MTLEFDVAIQMLKGFMGDKRWTTEELEEALATFGYRCPDSLPRSLNMLRTVKKINGEYDEEAGCWYWWA